MSWLGYLDNLLNPNPQHFTSLIESRLFNEEERKEIWELIKGAMVLVSLNSLAGLSKDLKKEKEFIDGSVEFWNKKFNGGLMKIVDKVNKSWNE